MSRRRERTVPNHLMQAAPGGIRATAGRTPLAGDDVTADTACRMFAL